MECPKCNNELKYIKESNNFFCRKCMNRWSIPYINGVRHGIEIEKARISKKGKLMKKPDLKHAFRLLDKISNHHWETFSDLEKSFKLSAELKKVVVEYFEHDNKTEKIDSKENIRMDTDELRRASISVFLATEEELAQSLSDLLKGSAVEIERLREIIKTKQIETPEKRGLCSCEKSRPIMVAMCSICGCITKPTNAYCVERK